MPRSQNALLLLPFGLGLVLWHFSACSGDTETTTPDAGTDVASSGGSGATGGAGGTSGGAGGFGGTGAAPSDAGDLWGAEPKWEPIAGSAFGCTFERLVNAADVRMFAWEKCSWTDGCEQAVFNPGLFGKSPGVTISPAWSVQDDGKTTRVALPLLSPMYAGLFANDDGWGMALLRLVKGTGDCFTPAAQAWGDRYAVMVEVFGQYNSHGGLLGSLSETKSSPTVFTLPNPPPGGPQRFALGESRWMWEWGMPNRLTTVSALDGGQFTEIATTFAAGSYAGVVRPVSTGSTFLFGYYQILDGGSVQPRIGWSDGVSPLQPYLVPESPTDGYGAVAYAHSHIGFQKAINNQQDLLYETVEVWAAPYQTDPGLLAPELVSVIPHHALGGLIGGWGRLAMPIWNEADQTSSLTIWDIATKAEKTHTPLPKDHVLNPPLMGLTHTHLWAGAAKPNAGPASYLMRFNVQ